MSIVLNKKLILASLISLIEFFQFIQCGSNFNADSKNSSIDLIFIQSVRSLVKLIKFILCIRNNVFDMNVIYLRENFTQFLFFRAKICRHGDRNILEPYPNDPFKDWQKFWTEGFGQLTNVSELIIEKTCKNFEFQKKNFLAGKNATVRFREIYA